MKKIILEKQKIIFDSLNEDIKKIDLITGKLSELEDSIKYKKGALKILEEILEIKNKDSELVEGEGI
jgi:hypothetical protein